MPERHSRRCLDSEPRRLSSGDLPSPGVSSLESGRRGSDEPVTEQEVLEAQTDIAGQVFLTRLADTSPMAGEYLATNSPKLRWRAKLIRTSRSLRAVRTRGTGQFAPGAPRTVRMPYAYRPRPCRTYRVPWYHPGGAAPTSLVDSCCTARGRASARPSCSPEAARSVSPSQGHADDNVSEEEGGAEEEEEEGDLRRSSTRSDTCSSASERVLSEADLTRLSLRSPSSLDAEPPATLQLRKINLSGFSLHTPSGSSGGGEGGLEGFVSYGVSPGGGLQRLTPPPEAEAEAEAPTITTEWLSQPAARGAPMVRYK